MIYNRSIEGSGCNGVQREHNKKLNNGLPILHKVPPKRDYGRYFCIMAEKGGTSHGGLTEKLSPFFHAKKQEVNAYAKPLTEKQMEDYELKPAPGNPDRVHPSITARLKEGTRGQKPPKEPGQKRSHKNHEER